MNIHTLLSTEEREKILRYLLKNPSNEINMNKLARELRLSVGQIHKYVTILRKERLVDQNRLQEIPITKTLRLLFNIKRIQEKRLVAILKNHLPKSKSIGIYGSWANGTNLEGADLDIWVKMDNEPADLELAKTRKKLEKKLGVPVDLTIATPERLKHFREKSDAFYFSLYNGIILWGEGL
ncbi:nucleotidyltransferase domain-containing protein [Candidatus Micrarchaeota archaeon]|nr:nucleotidyltransferase domain-containing protein [Candidatus Micrarchaeota archaeon]